MSTRYPGGLITRTPVVPTSSAAPGVWTLEQALENIKAGTWPVTNDPYFNYVTALLHFDGTNGAQNNTFLDSSTNAFSITRNGNTTQGSFSPFSRPDGGWSNYFDGTDILTIPYQTNNDLSSGDFTVEGWINFSAISTSWTTNTPSNQYIFDVGSNGTYFSWRSDTGGRWIFQGTTISSPLTYNQVPTVGQWYHFAITRSGNTYRLFIGGTLRDTQTNSGGLVQSNWNIGDYGGGGSYGVNGYISNFRVVKGAALYTASFTPSTTPLTTTVSSGTTAILTCQSNRLKDNSVNNYSITRTGEVSVQVFSPFNPTTAYSTTTTGGSGYFDGSGDYLNAGSSSAFAMGTGAYTVEMWVYVPSNGNQAFFAVASTGGLICIIDSGSGGLAIASRGSAASVGGGSVQPNAWNHLVFCRASTASNQTAIFVNGARTALGTDPNNYTVTGPAYVGALDIAGYNVTGYISGLRVVKGTAVYDPTQTTLTVPTSPPTNITNTSLLLNFTNGGIFDNAAGTNYETISTFQIGTSIKKFGTGSGVGNGTSTALCSQSSTNFGFGTGDFTIEGWFYLNPNASRQPFIKIGSDPTSAIQVLRHDNGFSQALGYLINSANGFGWFPGVGVTNSVWNHIAVARQGTSMRFFLNGALVGTVTSSDNLGTAYPLNVGVDYNGSVGNRFLDGYADDVRITKGYARYTANFTPPTAPFADK